METLTDRQTRADRWLVRFIGILLIAYAVSAALGWQVADVGESGKAAAAELQESSHYWAILPFILLLAAIAILPLSTSTAHWWESNRHKAFVAVNLALVTLLYLAVLHPQGSIGRAGEILRHTIVSDYIPFIVLLFSLYTISGGIRIAGDLRAHSATNSMFLIVGAILASFIGTTGAAMLLIRPLLETNRERRHVAHTVVFFIFMVCNCGGLLLPLGDPPLFLGYLNGVAFLWTLSLWKSWLLVNGLLVAVYFLLDHFYFYASEAPRDISRDETRTHRLKFRGLWPNAGLIGGVILAVALLDPGQAFPGTAWHPWFYLREMVELGLVALSIMLGQHSVRRDNNFDYLAIIEVACLFIGIFVCMQPALEILRLQGASLGIDTPHKFFWASGWLSSVLDNAPTYLVFFEAAKGLPSSTSTMAGVSTRLLTAISLGSVMMGAMTYIGNGPNFMVKSIAQQAGVAMPTFFGYLRYSFGILLPIIALDCWLLL